MTRQELMHLRFWVQFWVQSHPNLRNQKKMLRYYRGERDAARLINIHEFVRVEQK